MVFAKKPKRVMAPAVVPETPTVIMEEVVTEVGPDVRAEAKSAEPRKRRTKSGSSHAKPRVSLTEVVAVPGQEMSQATSELISLGHALFEKGKVREAKIIFEGLSLSMPHDAFIRTMLGTVSLALNDLPAALEFFEAALQLDPNDVAARVYRGELRLHRRKLRLAIDDLEYAITHGAATDPFVERAKRLLTMARKSARASR